MNTTLGPRPTNPAEISFAPHCFRQDGEVVEYVVPAGRGAGSYPKRFTVEADASAYAARVGRPMERRVNPRMVRVSWR